LLLLKLFLVIQKELKFNTTYEKTKKVFEEEVDKCLSKKEETWDSIQEDYRSKWTDYDSLFKYLKENYNVPTKIER